MEPQKDPRPDGPQGDPDAHGLPPGVVLPEPHVFARDQLKGLVISNAVGFVALLLLSIWSPTSPKLLAMLAGLLGVMLVVNVGRWALAARKVARSGSDERD